jgi:trehalose/maltose transport system substrate-binding protein
VHIFVRTSRSKRTKCFLIAGLLIITAGSCEQKPRSSVTLTVIDTAWLNSEYQDWQTLEWRRFTRESGIAVQFLPAPETAVDQLVLWRTLLESHSSSPDVYAIDVIWPALLAPHLQDLKPYTAQETPLIFPQLIANNTVNGRLVAVPDRIGVGLLFYRTDLLAKYGYQAPPATWEQLRDMAMRIQTGERAKGQKDFWGFVWQGAPSEALTCNALEWQISEGGGQIIEADRTISINNAATVRSWERAARWIGSISPPSVADYLEWDAVNMWLNGKAAFMRNWPAAYVISQTGNSRVKNKFEVSVLPRGQARHAAVLGGTSYGISRYSRYPQEAVRLIRFMCRRDVQLWRTSMLQEPPIIPDLYRTPEARKAVPYVARFEQAFLKSMVARPSNVTGEKYPDVSRAYFEAVHSVLARRKPAKAAVAELEAKLIQITAFQPHAAAQTNRVLP